MMRLSVGMRKLVCVAAVDFICIAIVAIPCLLLNLVGEPYMRDKLHVSRPDSDLKRRMHDMRLSWVSGNRVS